MKIYVYQNYGWWSLTEDAWRAMVARCAEGESYDLDKSGRALSRRPNTITMGKDGSIFPNVDGILVVRPIYWGVMQWQEEHQKYLAAEMVVEDHKHRAEGWTTLSGPTINVTGDDLGDNCDHYDLTLSTKFTRNPDDRETLIYMNRDKTIKMVCEPWSDAKIGATHSITIFQRTDR